MKKSRLASFAIFVWSAVFCFGITNGGDLPLHLDDAQMLKTRLATYIAAIENTLRLPVVSSNVETSSTVNDAWRANPPFDVFDLSKGPIREFIKSDGRRWYLHRLPTSRLDPGSVIAFDGKNYFSFTPAKTKQELDQLIIACDPIDIVASLSFLPLENIVNSNKLTELEVMKRLEIFDLKEQQIVALINGERRIELYYNQNSKTLEKLLIANAKSTRTYECNWSAELGHMLSLKIDTKYADGRQSITLFTYTPIKTNEGNLFRPSLNSPTLVFDRRSEEAMDDVTTIRTDSQLQSILQAQEK